ncbi:hypothetical protein [Peteryoungia algae]|uniref:Uncharacterized protein n=1 Tax=Peteryoungia algae TaxID=2919917 RepID=A0ABT0D1U3_9HYPH|nr:hypothetical protein [Rhizobium sp. SSM4.3]MCJ8239395.1 hypothetical protein [Rhizobium sp. SSM4.3]
MPWLNTAFFAGAIGGMSPELARILVRAQGGQIADWFEKLAQEPWLSILAPIAGSIAILVLLGLIGGIVAHYGNEPNISKAFVLGVGAPAFLLSTAGAIAPVKDVVKDTEVKAVSVEIDPKPTELLNYLGEILVTTGHAQDLPSEAALAPQLIFDTKAIAGACPACRVEFQDSSGSVLSSETVGGDKATVVTVPDTATSAILSGVPDSNSAKFSLESLAPPSAQEGDRPISVEVTKSRNYLNDVLYILGNSAIEPFDLELKAAEAE